MKNKEQLREILKDKSHEEKENMIVNLIVKHFGDDFTVHTDGGQCCPPGSCGVCVNETCVKC